MKNFFKGLSVIFLSSFCFLFATICILNNGIAPKYYVTDKNFDLNMPSSLSIKINNSINGEAVPASVTNQNTKNNADIMLMGIIPVSNIEIETVPETQLIPCGAPFGIKIYTQGVMIVGITDVNNDGNYQNPAKSAGLAIGDIITDINGEKVNSNTEVANAIEASNGQPLELNVKRNKENFIAVLNPIKSSSDNCYKAGIWVRDSCAGIGTLTYYDPIKHVFAGLGHGICDVDTGEILPLLTGDIVKANIVDVSPGRQGCPGELKGCFVNDKSIGTIKQNSDIGLYGMMDKNPCNNQPISVATKQQVKTGHAQIYTTVEGETPEYYDVEIESINHNPGLATKNMVIKITSQELLDKTGGIVQGMSGSPIIQDNKLVGAITHVFVNNPTKGYAVFAENMLENSNNLS